MVWWRHSSTEKTFPTTVISQNRARSLLEVINNFGLFIQLPDVHHPLAQLSPTSINHLVPRLASGVKGLLFNESNQTSLKTLTWSNWRNKRKPKCWLSHKLLSGIFARQLLMKRLWLKLTCKRRLAQDRLCPTGQIIRCHKSRVTNAATATTAL